MKLLIFSGTSEGHALCRFLSERGAQAEVCVATAYGAAVMAPLPGIRVSEGRLTAEEMAARLGGDTLVVDATHPYAHVVTENIRAACTQAGADYLRLLRPSTAADGVIAVPDTAAAVDWLNAHPGRALLTTGSKELAAYTAVTDWRDRLFPRVLPTANVLASCEALGFPGASVIAMQGPFSHEMNVALLRKTGASILVTKDTGTNGGFTEKLSAAREVGAAVLMIARPTAETGLPLTQMQALLAERLGLADPAPTAPEETPRFPLFVSLTGRRALIVGAGRIAARRAAVLRAFGAEVVVIAPEQRADFPEGVIWRPEAYDPSALTGAALVVAACDDRAVNRAVGEECRARGIPVSVADRAEESTFYFPAVCQGGGLTAGLVSDTGAKHHAVKQAAARIRRVLREEGNHGTN